MILMTIRLFFDSTCSANTFSSRMEVLNWPFVVINVRNHLLEVASFEVSQVNIFCTIVPSSFSSFAVFVLVWEHPN